jgi:hypothetical protein
LVLIGEPASGFAVLTASPGDQPGCWWYNQHKHFDPLGDQMTAKVHAVDRPELAPLSMPDRFRHEIAYFMSVPGVSGVPQLAAGEYWVRSADADRWLDEGVLRIISPLDANNCAEIELTEEHEAWLQWMIANQVQRIRLT